MFRTSFENKVTWYVVLLLALPTLVPTLKASILPPGFIETPLATGLDPTALTQAPDGRIFITEKYGAVRVVENGVLLPDPMIYLQVDNYNERGLSGIALHPDFPQINYIYFYFTLPNSGRNRLSRFKVYGNYADPMSEEVLLEGEQLAGTVHNGGAMAFGPDGKLYLALGDGASGNNASDLSSILGKVLRLNPDGSIPTDNPFYNQNNGNARAIWAYGFRNPFSLTIQASTGKVFVCDVGSDFYEEVNYVEAGIFYGWNQLEGLKSWQTMPDNYRDPIYTYSHSLGCAVVGASFYSLANPSFPAFYQDNFYFADYCKGHIKIIDPITGQLKGVFASQIDRPLAIFTGNDGAMYYISRGGLGGGSEQDNTSSQEGMLWKIEYVGNGAPVFSVHPKSVLVAQGESATFQVQVNGTQPINYTWERDGQPVPLAFGTELTLDGLLLADSGAVFRCTAANSFGQVSSQEAVLKVTANQRPMPMITSPPDDFLYSAGEPITFAGFATDPENGTLSADDLVWRIDLHHNDHNHPGLAATPGIDMGTFELPTIGETAENVWVRILLTATDMQGLSRTVYKDIYPRKSILSVKTSQPGIPVRVDGITYFTPFETASVRGLRRLVEAPRMFADGDTLRVFKQWSDGYYLPSKTVYPSDSLLLLLGEYTDLAFGNGSGLLGTYYNGDEEGNFLQPILTRIDTTIHFDWMNDSPDPLVPNDNFTVRWTGYIEPLFTADYTFAVGSDDGCRLWVNDLQIIDFWKPKTDYEVFGHLFLEAGKHYPITLEYYEAGGGASAHLKWSTTSMAKTLVPKSQLFPRLPEYQKGLVAHFKVGLQPNPIRDNTLRLQFDFTHRDLVNIAIYNASGKQVAFWNDLIIDSPHQVVELPTDNLGQGVYFLHLIGSASGEKARMKVLKI